MRRKYAVFAPNLLLVLLCALLLTSTARADFGPKPSLTITVINAPEGELYLDLLAEGTPIDFIRSESEKEYDPAILASLRTLERQGWSLACSSGLEEEYGATLGVLYGKLGCWEFSYWLPDDFYIAAATADQAQSARAPRIHGFFTYMVYDWQSNTVHASPPPLIGFFDHLMETLILTLVIEGFLLYRFGFYQPYSWRIFLNVNILTQLGLHLFCNISPVITSRSALLLPLLGPELVILLIEAAAFACFLQEQSVKRRIEYALCANGASFLASCLSLFLCRFTLM